MGHAPDTLAEIAKRVEARIDELLFAECERWAAVDAGLAEPLQSLHRLVLAGGKRLRPAFAHWAFVGAGGDADDPAIADAGAALELLHTFALVHDDVMDGSSRRRGLDAVHKAFEAAHGDGGWRGEGRRFGEGVAILVGDLAFVYADLLLADAPPPAHAVFTELRLEVNVGQYLDLVGTVQGGTTCESARRIRQYKSGKYTVERPLHLGAALAGRLDGLEGPLTAYGMPLGEAFQLRDDLLGVYGDTAVTGKPVGEDLREGKPTALIAHAIERASGADADLLANRLGSADMDEAEIRRLQEVLEATGARDEVERTIDRLLDEALDAVALAPLSQRARDELADLAAFVVSRDH